MTALFENAFLKVFQWTVYEYAENAIETGL